MNDTFRRGMAHLCVISIALMLNHCGYVDMADEAPTPPTVARDSGSYLSDSTLWWEWHCDAGNDMGILDRSEGRMVLRGGDQVSLRQKDLARPERMGFAGEVCDATGESSKRDVIFLIDVSSNTNNADPMFDGTCRRAAMLDQAVAALTQESGASFAVYTFAGQIMTRTAGFHRSSRSLVEQWHSQFGFERLEDAVCVGHPGVAPMQAITELLPVFSEVGRAEALRQIYVVTDSEPDLALWSSKNFSEQRVTFGVVTSDSHRDAWVSLVGSDARSEPLIDNNLEERLDALAQLVSEVPVSLLEVSWVEHDIRSQVSIRLADFTVKDRFTVIPTQFSGNSRWPISLSALMRTTRRWTEGERIQAVTFDWQR